MRPDRNPFADWFDNKLNKSATINVLANIFDMGLEEDASYVL
jgi:hypothetical protein